VKFPRRRIETDKHWVRLGQIDPYLQTVRTLDPYKLDRSLQRDSLDPYFASGESYVADLFGEIERCVQAGYLPKIAVDFGCSVGRVAIPLAKRAQRVVGLDVSAEALAEAERNAARFGVKNAEWLTSDDGLTRVTGPVDLFHSYNVLQHLPIERGLAVVRRALDLLSDGGVLAVHVPYADRASPLRRAINWSQANVPGVNLLANVVRGRPMNYPQMLMNVYELPELLTLVRAHGCETVHLKLIDQGRYPGAVMIARVRRP